MSLYGNKIKLGGVPCGMVMRGAANGEYIAVFEREHASLEQIEAIDWGRLEVDGESILPASYGYEVREIAYDMTTRSYQVWLRVGAQYLGDVAGYESQVAELTQDLQSKSQSLADREATIQAQSQQIQDLEAAGSAEGIREDLTAAYQEGVESNG